MTDTTKKEFTVGGMSCGGCVQSVTKAIARLPGVRNVDVSLANNAATVEYDDATVEPAAIVAAIEAAGFEAAPR
jgi:copper ion binding protein